MNIIRGAPGKGEGTKLSEMNVEMAIERPVIGTLNRKIPVKLPLALCEGTYVYKSIPLLTKNEQNRGRHTMIFNTRSSPSSHSHWHVRRE